MNQRDRADHPRRGTSAFHPLSCVFEAASVAVVGASSDPTKRGHQILKALCDGGYAGSVYPINPKGGEILGRTVYRDLAATPEPAELAVVCTPASTTPGVMEQCGRAGVRAAVILAVGFGESGDEGEDLQREMMSAAKTAGVRVVGPNTSGVLNLPLGLNLIGARDIRPGGLALLVQSGNMALSLMNEATRHSWNGISVCAGLGNEADVGFGECLDFLAQHDDTAGIIVYVEGLRDGRAFLDAAGRVSPHKPIVLIKSARSEVGQQAARSHTGAVAGAYDRLQAGLAQVGVIEVTRTDELLHVAQAVSFQPPVTEGKGIIVLSDGGGQGTLAVDALSEQGVELANLAASTRRLLGDRLGPAASTLNPVDLAGAADADPLAFADALEVIMADPAVGGVLLVGLFGGYGIRFSEGLAEAEEQAAGLMLASASKHRKALVVHSMYADRRSAPLEILGMQGVPVIESLDVACRAVAEVWRRGRRVSGEMWSSEQSEVSDSEPLLDRTGVRTARDQGREVLTEVEARQLLGSAGVSFPEASFCTAAEEAMAAVRGLGGPAVLKVVSAKIPHKTDAGGVALRVLEDGARDAFDGIMRSARQYLQGGEPDGVLVLPMLPAPSFELLIGAYRDPQLGPVLSIGAGGVWVEVLADVAHRVLPVTSAEIRRMVSDLRVAPILRGVRGSEGINLDAVVEQALAIGRVILEVPTVAEVEVNPVFAYADRAIAVDARIFLVRDRDDRDPEPH